jgi:hypothetical protein
VVTKRTPIHRDHRPTITPQMVELFHRGREIQATGGDEVRESEGGRMEEFSEITKALQRLLKRRVGQCHLFDHDAGYDRDDDLDPNDPDWRDWRGARAAYRALTAALKERIAFESALAESEAKAAPSSA